MNTLWLATLGYFAVLLAIGLSNSVVGPTLATLAQQVGVSLSAISMLFVARSLGAIAGSLSGGWLLDRFPGHRVLGAMLLAFAAGLVTISLSHSLMLLVCACFVIAFCELAADVAANTLTAWTQGARAPAVLSILHLFFGLGSLLAPLLVWGLLSLELSPIVAFSVLATFLAILIPVFIYLPSPSRRVPSVSSPSSTSFSRVNIFLCGLFMFLYVGAETGIGGWLAVYVEQRNLGSPEQSTQWLTLFWASLMAGRLLLAPVIHRYGPAKVLFVNTSTALAALLAWALFPPDNSSAMMWFAITCGFGMTALFPTMLGYVDRCAGLTGQLAGYFFAGASLGLMVIPWIIGQLIEPWGADVLLYLVAGDMALAWILLVIILRKLPKGIYKDTPT